MEMAKIYPAWMKVFQNPSEKYKVIRGLYCPSKKKRSIRKKVKEIGKYKNNNNRI